ncbi:hypothetical protein E3Q22_02904 [Wallemia mellicola]|uniref:Sugar phosphate transporter domain-containing protein n=2 Tax=Wallemia mellicola TaxID=1708541 RepID=A0A4T0TPI8_9BASI|nr:hypothetical protein WALSEDRAFT_60424 [Wallemia mellicola CBS 633.66]TIB71163.1 hypothetical protein E3Q24_02510 [Wallemia mellicola]EIM21424.1 hypothetical protein WALSEDRAFT_60424 [Wallemia mellicola CBS 633.66]TIB74933.1 hypothetical protein E3Q23_02536 [Wallemia mellicola]TIB77814.1 hypothetical protein E3Q22_02904 [Wallemia mellicola]TIB86444.1 hypothetical protein E3Q21_01687 [Wallemia mellicola]|eukprot:XP_006958455.1 hypothetical protein WALSEDRAFT_60424 [Wallemia mellicola CBS 633.66]
MEHTRSAVTAVVIFYLTAAIIMVLVNKAVLNVENTPPLFFLFVQLAIAVILLLASHLFRLVRLPKIERNVARGLWKLIMINVAGLSFNNYCLKYIDASFYQVARGLVLPITVAISYIFLRTRPSPWILGACVIICLGFFISVHPGEADLNATGIVFGLLSSLTTAAHAVIIKTSLPVVGGSTIDLAYYVNLFSSILFIPLSILVGEIPTIYALFFETDSNDMITFAIGALITGVVGFLICIAGFLSIKVTSPITHMVSSAVRSALMAILGVVFFHDNLTTEKIISIIVIVIGSVFYTWIKDKENKPAMTYNNEEYEQVEQQPLETIHIDSDTRRNSEDILFEAPPEYSEQDAHR